MKIKAIFLALSLFICLTSAARAEGDSGLPVPRFVSLKSEETNIRTGPGTRYPILWVYRRKHFPVEVIEEYDLWRKIRDVENSVGWVHKSMLDGNRYVVIKAKEPITLRSEPVNHANGVVRAEPMVFGRLIECEAEWCHIQIAGRKGWAPKEDIWGIYANEVFD